MDISTLRKMRGNSDFSKIAQEFEKTANPQSNKSSYKDDRFWKPEPDKAGNASATIRFLPATIKEVDGVTVQDELPWVRIYSHGFQGPTGKWYIEESLSTIGLDDPVGQLNSKLWNSGIEADKEIARKQKRKLSYIANVLIVSDPKHPELEGQVKLFKFGKKIYDKIMDKARPTFEDEDPVNVFDLWDGADFKLRMRKVEGYPNYDQSTFMAPAPVCGGDEEEILKIVNAQYLLKDFLDPKNFKSYEELSRKLASVLDGGNTPITTAANIAQDDDYVPPKREEPKKAAVKIAPAPTVDEDDDGDDAMAYFRKIAQED